MNIHSDATGRLARICAGFLSLWLFAIPAFAGTVTAATGGGAIPSNTTSGCDAAGWTALTGPSYAEANGGEVSTGTIILDVPAGFEFNTAATVTVLITGNNRANRNINNLPTGTSAAVTSITATQITFTVTASSTRANTLTWQGIQVRPTASSPQASGNITSSGTATLNGVTPGTTNFGTLTEVASTPVCTAGGTASSVTANPTLCVTDSSNGSAYPWSGLANVGAQDNTYATATGINSSVTQYLVCTGYGFAIPAGATIDGISVGPWVNSTYTFTDNAMQLVKANAGDTAYVIQPTNLATGANTFPNGGGTMAVAPTQLVYGGSTNLWGNPWTVADINAVNFGAAFAAQRGPYATTQTAGVDAMPITVYYTAPPQPLATYHMDAASWNGTAGEVTDSSGNGNNAQAFNSATTDGTTPAIASNPGTCRYGVFDNGTTITSGYIQTPLPNFTTDFTVTAWVRTTNNTITGQRILIDDQNNTGGYGISLGDGGTGIIRFYSRGIAPVILDSTVSLANNTWYFVAAVADITNRIRTLYVFDSTGTLLGSTSDAAAFTGTWGTDAGPVSIGGETNASGEPPANFHFRGNLDEVQVFPSALSQSQLATIATQTHACTVVGPDHILVQHDGNGLTCTPETLTITACANAACTAPNYTASTVTGVVTWTGTPGGSVPFNIVANGTTTASLPVTTAQTVVLGVSAVNPAETNPGADGCWDTGTSTASCSLPFADSGLLISAPNHVSESLQNMTISAVRKANNALDCVPAFANVSRAVNLTCTYANPASGTLPVRVAGLSLNSANNAAAACDATGQSPTLAFDANGTATTTLQYADVGQMSLSATYTGSAGTGDAGLVMTGSSSFIAAPASFSLSSITGSPIKAGNAFSATVTALNSAASPTPNFGQENLSLPPPGNIPESVTLSFTRCQPTGANAVNGTFSGSLGAFTGGAATATNLNWDEVGNGDLTATLTSGSYLGSGLSATGNTGTGGTVCNGAGGAGNVGPFIPDHFDTAIINGCLACGFTYSGQPFSVYVTARNGLATPTTTLNYDGTATSPSFAKDVTLSAWDDATGTTQNPGGALLPAANTAVPYTAFSQGMASLNTAATMPFYTFTTVPTVPTIIRIRATDTDNVTSLRSPLSSSTEGQPEIRSGRIKISGAYGSELLQLPIPLLTQYWDATSAWVTSSTDSVTSFVVATPPATSAVNFGNYQQNLTAISVAGSPATVNIQNGVGSFTLAAPGINSNGSVDISIPALAGVSCKVVPVPLGCYLPSNTARAAFGLYSGNKNFIYQNEKY